MALAAKPDDHPAPRKIDAEVLAPDDRHSAGDVCGDLGGRRSQDCGSRAACRFEEPDIQGELWASHPEASLHHRAVWIGRVTSSTAWSMTSIWRLKDETLAKYLEGAQPERAAAGAEGSYQLRGVLEVSGDGRKAPMMMPVLVKSVRPCTLPCLPALRAGWRFRALQSSLLANHRQHISRRMIKSSPQAVAEN